MNPREFFKTESRQEIDRVCRSAETTFENFQQIACFGGSVSARLAKRLAESSDGRMTVVEILYPNDPEMLAARERRKKTA